MLDWPDSVYSQSAVKLIQFSILTGSFISEIFLEVQISDNYDNSKDRH